MLNKNQIKKFLNTSIFGKYLYYFKDIDSINSFAHSIAKEGAPEGTVVLTDYQKAGQGRQGNKWRSDKNANILMSIILRPELDVECIQQITLATTNILIQSLKKILENKKADAFDFCPKWPNDIMLNGKKMGCIITESSLIDKRIEYVAVGININVNQDISKLDDEIKPGATSIYSEIGEKFSREKLIAQILMDYEKKYFFLERTNYNTVIEDWKKHCQQIGQLFVFETPLCVEQGYFVDISNQGVLIYKTRSGKLKKLVRGSIKYKKAVNGTSN